MTLLFLVVAFDVIVILPLIFMVLIIISESANKQTNPNLTVEYPVGTGLRRMAVTRTETDRDKLLECAVLLELRRRGIQTSYWRGKREVDFVATTAAGITPIQVSWESPSPRHHRALEEYYETFPQAREALFIGPREYEDGLLDCLMEE